MKAELKRLIQNLGDLAALADDLDKLKSIEQTEQEANARISAAQREATRLHDEAKAHVEAMQASAQSALDEAKADADKQKAAARTHADNVIEKAERTAAELIRQADAKFSAAVARHEAAEQAVTDAEARKESAAEELAILEQRLAEVRALISPLAG